MALVGRSTFKVLVPFDFANPINMKWASFYENLKDRSIFLLFLFLFFGSRRRARRRRSHRARQHRARAANHGWRDKGVSAEITNFILRDLTPEQLKRTILNRNTTLKLGRSGRVFLLRRSFGKNAKTEILILQQLSLQFRRDNSNEGYGVMPFPLIRKMLGKNISGHSRYGNPRWNTFHLLTSRLQ